MKKLLYLAIVVHLLVCCKNKEIEVFQGPPEPNEGDTSIYNTNRYRLTKILNFGKSHSKEPGGHVLFIYDAEGNLAREAMYDALDLLFTYKDYTYRDGRMITQKVYDGPVNSLTLSTTIFYTYEDDLLTQEKVMNSNGELLHSIHYVHANRKLAETYTWPQSLGKHHHYKYTYDGSGNVTRMQVYMYNNELSSTENYTYDSQNRLIKKERFDHQNRLEVITITQYTGNNTLPSAEMYQDAAGNMKPGRTYKFDVAGNQVRTLIGTNTLNKRKYYGKLLREEILYSSTWSFAEMGMNRYEYEKK